MNVGFFFLLHLTTKCLSLQEKAKTAISHTLKHSAIQKKYLTFIKTPIPKRTEIDRKKEENEVEEKNIFDIFC